MRRTVCCLLFLFLTGCTAKTPTHFKGIAMTMSYTIQVGDSLSQKEQTAIEKTILSTFSEVHQIYNNWNPNSEISKLNRLPARQKVTISPELVHFLLLVDKLVALTENRFDPTVEPLQKLWKEKMRSGLIPTEKELTRLFSAVGWQNIHIEGTTVWKEHELTAIDVGAVAKGYAVDLLVERLHQAGFKSIYVEWGGEIRTAGTHPEGRKWRIALSSGSTLELYNQAIATSGNYLQKWTINEITYTHVIDPHSKQPLHVTDRSIGEVHVISDTCARADAIATALMLFEVPIEAENWAKERDILAEIH